MIEKPNFDLTLMRKQGWDRLNEHKILFEDFDGVLHPESGDPDMHFCFMPNFCEAFEAAEQDASVHIVISSLWRVSSPIEELAQHFPERLRNRVVGVTPDLDIAFESPIGSRQNEIEAWMAQHAPNGQWLAIDDRLGGCASSVRGAGRVDGWRLQCGGRCVR